MDGKGRPFKGPPYFFAPFGSGGMWTSQLEEVADLARQAGLPVKALPGWKSRSRPYALASQPCGVVAHHTVGVGDHTMYDILPKGHGTLPGPLCHLGLRQSGEVVLVAAGFANHAGKTSPALLRELGGNPNKSGNSQLLGIEAEHSGRGAWSTTQYDAYVLLASICCEVFGLKARQVVGHKESAFPKGRKVDPNFSMSDFRMNVAETRVLRMVDNQVSDWAEKPWEWGEAVGLVKKETDPKARLTKEELVVFLHRMHHSVTVPTVEAAVEAAIG